MKMLGKRVLIRKLEDIPTSSVIEVVHLEEHSSQYADVISVGKDVDMLKVGDRVITVRYCGSPVEVDGEQLFVAMEEDILARIG